MKKVVVVLVIILLCSCNNKSKCLDINSKLVQDLYSRVSTGEDATILKYKYGNYKGFHNNYILAVAIKNYIDTQENRVEIIPKKDIENIIYKIFGSNIEFSNKNAYVLYKEICGFNYNAGLEQYELIPSCDGSIYDYFYHKIISAKEEDSTIIITEKVIYTVHSDNFKEILIYNDNYNQNLITKIGSELEIKIEDYLDRASTYEYIFEKNNDDYILKDLILKS